MENKKMNKVFLGGTCNGSGWRDELKKQLKIPYFDPVVDDWDEEAQKNEIKERENADYCLFVITPLMTGVYAIAEVVDDSNKQPQKTVLCVLDEDQGKVWLDSQKGSLDAVKRLVEENGVKIFDNLEDVAIFLNDQN